MQIYQSPETFLHLWNHSSYAYYNYSLQSVEKMQNCFWQQISYY